jgi:predicted acyl esterase
MSAISLLNLWIFLGFQIQVFVYSSNLIYNFTTENVWLSMPDGIRLSASLAIPISKYKNEKFPVLLEYKPYRKDDSFYNFNQPQIFYLARRGYIVSENESRNHLKTHLFICIDS